MVHVSLTSSRCAFSIGLSTLLAAAVALSGCSSPPKKVVAAPATTAVVVAPTTAPLPAFTVKGMSASLAAVIKPLYFGGKVASSASAAKALGKRVSVKAPRRVVATGSVSSWKGVPIAVVTSGKDVTLLVATPKWKVVGGWWPSIGVATPALGGARRVLLIGSDARPGEAVERSRADSLHIVGLDGRGGGGIVGIARDAYVPLSTGGRGKINSALAYGGPKAQTRTVAAATGVPLEGYLITGFRGFKGLINGIGGLPLTAPVAVKDSGSGANVKKGANDLTGKEALAYGRARHGVAGGDFGRSANQGRLILAAAGFVKLAGPAKLPGILHMAATKMGTNLSAERVLTFAAGAYVTNPKKVRNRVAAGGFGMTGGGESIVLLDAAARHLFADIRNGNLS